MSPNTREWFTRSIAGTDRANTSAHSCRRQAVGPPGKHGYSYLPYTTPLGKAQISGHTNVQIDVVVAAGTANVRKDSDDGALAIPNKDPSSSG